MEYVIEMLNITKEFPGIRANDNITVRVKKGEVHALLGENGAGKSTLMSILFGLYQPTSGNIKVRGKEVKINSPLIANDLGIGMVHQHFKLVENFTVLENIVLGKETTKKGFLKNDDAEKKVKGLISKYKLNVDINAKIEDISVGMQQRVEILKMLYRDAQVLIFDEPTAVLTPQEIESLMGIINDLAAEGKSILIITHKLEEIKMVADNCTVIRKGKYIGTIEVANSSTEEMAEMMVGRKVNFNIEKSDAVKGTNKVLEITKLSMENPLSHKKLLKDISLEVRKGEILCIAGIEGNGQTELVEAITGLRKFEEGKIMLNNEDISHLSIRNRTLKGIGHIPEDRHKHGLVLDFNVAENLVLQSYYEDKFQNRGFLDKEAMYSHAEKQIKRFDIRSGRGSKSVARGMSGGNQQKLIIGREIEKNPDLLIAVQPTRGLDVGAIEDVHNEIIKFRDQGKAVLYISLELSEVMGISDRIAVMYEGEIVATVDPKEATENDLGLYMSGSKRGV